MSSLGNVRSLDRVITYSSGQKVNYAGVQLNPAPDRDGYLQVSLHRDGKSSTRKIHQLVLEAFDRPKPEGFLSRHLNNKRDDNRITNLRWGTPLENSRDLIEAGSHWQTQKSRCPNGHLLIPENVPTWAKKSGKRKCHSCELERSSARYQNRPFDKNKADRRYFKILEEVQ